MSLLKPATCDQAYLKCGILGFSSAGKTRTATEIAIGLHKFIGSKKPVAFIDTETGSDFVLQNFNRAKIPLITAKSRAFIDLMTVSKEVVGSSDILIVDSISHFWTDLTESFRKKKNIDRLQFQHWGPIKQEWRTFTDFYVNSKLHIIICGRAGWEYDFTKDDEGFKELVKTGTRMKTEGEMAYEPSLLIEMEKVRIGDGKIGQDFVNRAWVVKDRFDQINGNFFDKPTFESFLPHISLLNIGGEHIGVNTDNTSEDLFDNKNSRSGEWKQRQIFLEEVENEITLRWPSQSKEDKQAKIEILQTLFGTTSWLAIKELNADIIQSKLVELKLLPKETQTT